MTEDADPEVAIDPAAVRALRDVLQDHGVRVALLFGSAARPEGAPADVDLAFEFADRVPEDPGYASAYLDLYADLEDELVEEVDLVDVHTLSPRFAAVVFDDGVRIFGSPDRLVELAAELGGELPSSRDARERVAAAAARLREGSP